MTTDIRTILDFVLAERLRDICERRGVGVSGSRQEQRERVVRSLQGELAPLLPLLMRAELVEFLATRDVGGRFAFVSRAPRSDLERLLTMLVAGQPSATNERPLGDESLVRFERRVVRPAAPLPPPALPAKSDSAGVTQVSEKVFRSRVQRERGLIYYVKNGDVWAAPSRRGGLKRVPHRVHQAGVVADHVTYLYFVDADGDIARKRRDGAPLRVNPANNVDDEPVRVFICYAREDLGFLVELCKALGAHESKGELALMFDKRINPGTSWEPRLMDMVDRAEIAVFLLSNDFFVSKYCNEKEWPRIEQRHRRGECEVAPVLIRKCHFSKSPLGAHQLIRPSDRAVDEHLRHDDAWYAVVEALDALIKRARAKRT